MNEYKEYETVMIPLLNGDQREFAIMDEFDVEEKHYIVVSLVQADEIAEGYYLYRTIPNGDKFSIELIEDEAELEKASEVFASRA